VAPSSEMADGNTMLEWAEWRHMLSACAFQAHFLRTDAMLACSQSVGYSRSSSLLLSQLLLCVMSSVHAQYCPFV